MGPGVILCVTDAALCCGLGAAVLLRRERRLVHWAFAGGMASACAESLLGALSLDATLPDEVLFWQRWAMLALACQPVFWLAFSLCYSRGNYREFLVQWRWILVGAALIPVAAALWPNGTLELRLDRAAAEAGRLVVFGPAARTLHTLTIVASVLVLMNLERTFRTAVGTMRWRIKFVVLGLGLYFMVRVYTSTQVFLFSSLTPALIALQAGALLLGLLLAVASVARSRMIEVEVYPSRSFLFGSVSGLLAGVYLLVVGVLAQLVVAWGGDRAFPLKALVVLVGLVGLAGLCLSDRVRQRLQRLVSRHFKRPLYDYRQFWAVFTQRTSSLVDQTDLCRAVAKLTAETFDTLSVSVWLINDERQQLTLGASSLLSDDTATEVAGTAAAVQTLREIVRNHPQPFDIDQPTAAWAGLLGRLNPSHFGKGGNRICVPLVAGGQALGFITLADRVSGVPYSLEDLDLLKCVGDQAAAGLLTLQLSQRLVRAKELEAFQTMSAFFVHDLKNTASTLSLMLQNLPVHFNDPAFREDQPYRSAHALRVGDPKIAGLGQKQPRNRPRAPLEPPNGHRLLQSAQEKTGPEESQPVDPIRCLSRGAIGFASWLSGSCGWQKIRLLTSKPNGTSVTTAEYYASGTWRPCRPATSWPGSHRHGPSAGSTYRVATARCPRQWKAAGRRSAVSGARRA